MGLSDFFDRMTREPTPYWSTSGFAIDSEEFAQPMGGRRSAGVKSPYAKELEDLGNPYQDAVRKREETRRRYVAAAHAAVDAMAASCVNHGQLAVVEQIRPEFVSRYADGFWDADVTLGTGGEYSQINFPNFMRYWAQRVNEITGGTGVPNLPVVEEQDPDDEDAMEFEDSGGEGDEADQFFDFEGS